jgi:hypothetical protein
MTSFGIIVAIARLAALAFGPIALTLIGSRSPPSAGSATNRSRATRTATHDHAVTRSR